MFYSSSQRSSASERHERVTRFRYGIKTGELIGMRLQILEEPLKLPLHRVHLFPHVENDLDAREIHSKVASQRKYQLEPFKIRIGVKPCVSF